MRHPFQEGFGRFSTLPGVGQCGTELRLEMIPLLPRGSAQFDHFTIKPRGTSKGQRLFRSTRRFERVGSRLARISAAFEMDGQHLRINLRVSLCAGLFQHHGEARVEPPRGGRLQPLDRGLANPVMKSLDMLPPRFAGATNQMIVESAQSIIEGAFDLDDAPYQGDLDRASGDGDRFKPPAARKSVAAPSAPTTRRAVALPRGLSTPRFGSAPDGRGDARRDPANNAPFRSEKSGLPPASRTISSR